MRAVQQSKRQATFRWVAFCWRRMGAPLTSVALLLGVTSGFLGVSSLHPKAQAAQDEKDGFTIEGQTERPQPREVPLPFLEAPLDEDYLPLAVAPTGLVDLLTQPELLVGLPEEGLPVSLDDASTPTPSSLP